MLPKISIIVPVYQVEQYLDRCIQSIVDQTYSNLEILLVDDGSVDRCPQICDEWSLRDSRIKVIHQKNAGVAAARNTGLLSAQGEYLYFVDSDDVIKPNLCEKVMKVFSENDVDIVAFDCDQINQSGESIGGTENLNEGVLGREEALRQLLQGKINSYLWNKIYKRKVFENILFPNRTAFEDMAVVYQLFLKADAIFCLNEPLYISYRRTGSATAAMNARKLGELYQSRRESYDTLSPLYPDIAELAFPYIALAARRLFDRALWETANETVYAEAMAFLKDNKAKIMQTNRSFEFWLFYSAPRCYKLLRQGKHCVGNILRKTIKRS